MRRWLAPLLLLATASAGAGETLGLPDRVLPAPRVTIEDSAAWRARLLALFREGALLDETKRERGVMKWTRAIDLSLRGAYRPHADFVFDLADRLSALVGLPITVSTDQSWAGQIDVFITPVKRYWPFFVQAVDPNDRIFTCVAMPWVEDGVVRRSQIEINAGALPPEAVRACLVEEIVQSLGLFGETTAERATILDDEIGYQDLGPIDRLLLQTLYDPRLVPGTDLEAALPVAEAIIGERLRQLPCTAPAATRAC
jgi:hypothetical protein